MAGFIAWRKEVNWEYREIRREDLLEDDLYCLRYRVEGKELSGSIQSYAFLNPVLVLSRGNRFQVLSGFRRLHALRVFGQERIPAAVLSATENVPQALFRMALLLNEASSYGELDKAVIVSKARRQFDLSWRELECLAPLLGLPPSQKVLEDYAAVADLPEEFKDCVQDGKAAFKTALGLLDLQPEHRRVMIENVFRHCELSASESLEVMEWLSDLSRREKTNFLQIIHTQFEIIQNAFNQPCPQIFIAMQGHDCSVHVIRVFDKNVAALLSNRDVVIFQQCAKQLLPGNNRKLAHRLRDSLPFAQWR